MKRHLIAICAVIGLSLAVSTGAVPRGKSVTWEGGGRGRVLFSGKEHAEKGLKCDACHPALFAMKKNATKMTMAEMNKGAFCGACHNGSSAFSTSDERKCHKCHRGDGKEGHDRHHEEDRHNGHHNKRHHEDHD